MAACSDVVMHIAGLARHHPLPGMTSRAVRHQGWCLTAIIVGGDHVRIRRPARNSSYAKCGVYYAVVKDHKSGKDRPCVYLECTRSGRRLGPCWGQSKYAVSRALTRLGLQCDCPSRGHKASYFYGQRSPPLAQKDSFGTE
jgi:hypothetical protein